MRQSGHLIRTLFCITYYAVASFKAVYGQWTDIRELNWCEFVPSKQILLTETGEIHLENQLPISNIQISNVTDGTRSRERKEAVIQENTVFETQNPCRVQSYVRQDQTVVYKFWIPQILEEEEALGIELDFDMEVSLDVFEGDADIVVYRAGFSGGQEAFTSSWFGEGVGVDQIFISRYEFQRYPGEWRVNITSYVKQSRFELRLNPVYVERNLHPIDFLALAQIKSQCCSGSGSCPTIERALSAYSAQYAPRDICHTPPNWCDRDGRVVRLELDPLINDNLNCEFPSEFGYMISLQWLRMEFMLLHGPIDNVAEVVQQLPDLRVLDVALNGFTGSLPCELVSPSMRMLMLVGNLLTGTIPECFFNDAPELRELVIRENYLNGTLPTIPVDSKLAVLDVRSQKGGEKLTGPLPPVDQTLGNLVLFYTEDNQFTGTLPTFKSTSLKELGLAGNVIAGTVPEQYSQLKDLRYFNVSNNYISGRIQSKLLQLPRLEILDLAENLLTGSIPNNFRTSSLRYLGLSNNYFIGPFPQSVAHLPEISVVKAGNNRFTGRLGPLIQRLPKDNDVMVLELQGNKFTGAIPLEVSDLAMFNTSSSSSSASSNKVSRTLRLDHNQIADVLPQFLIAAVGGGIPDLVVNVSDNYIECPHFISSNVSSYEQLFQLTCLGPTMMEVPVLQAITWEAEKLHYNST